MVMLSTDQIFIQSLLLLRVQKVLTRKKQVIKVSVSNLFFLILLAYILRVEVLHSRLIRPIPNTKILRLSILKQMERLHLRNRVSF